MPEDAMGSERGEAYGGLFGAFPYAARSSESWLFRSYVLVGGLAALLVALLFGLAVVVLLGETVGAGDGVFSFSRTFFVFVALLIVAPLVAPILFVARHNRREGPDARYEFALAGLGYLFLVSLYVAGIISTPAAQQRLPDGPTVLRSAVALLYGLPRLSGLIPPLCVALAMLLVYRYWD